MVMYQVLASTEYTKICSVDSLTGNTSGKAQIKKPIQKVCLMPVLQGRIVPVYVAGIMSLD